MQIDKVSQEPARLRMLTAPFHGTLFFHWKFIVPGSTLAQVMACCQMAPSHYLDQCSHQYGPVTFIWGQEIPQPSITKIILKITYLSKISLKSPRHQWVNALAPDIAMPSAGIVLTMCTDITKLTGPRTFTDKQWEGPVKLLCIIMFKISKIRPKSLLGVVKAKKCLQCLCIIGS